MKRIKHTLFALALLLLACAADASAQNANLLKNPDAKEGALHWRAFKGAKVEDEGDERAFVLRGGGYFAQDVAMPKGSVGGYVVMVGSGMSERADAGSSLTGAPCLYGYMMNAGDPSGGTIYDYLQVQSMCGTKSPASGWVRVWGIFRVPEGTERLRFFIRQGERRGVSHDGSATRFRDLGLYLFPTEAAAKSFVGPEAATVYVRRRTGDGVTACELWRARPAVVELYGLSLGMNMEEVATVFPGIEEREETRRALERARSERSFGEASVFISTAPYNTLAKADGVTRVWLKMLDGKVYSIYLDYSGASWKTVEDFIASRASAWNLPPAETWHVVQPNSSRYLICDDTELRFYDAPDRSVNENYVRLVDLAAEKTLARRKTERNRAAR